MKDVICEEAARLGSQAYGDRLRAVALTGSLARNEATFVRHGQGCQLLGDAEFLFVFDERAPLASAHDLESIKEKITQGVCRRGIRAEVTLSAARPSYLRRLPPSIFAYELRSCGQIVAGDPEILRLIPEFTRADIPLDDAWQILANRLVEQLESVEELLEGRPTLSPGAHYRTVKLYLDMATSLLVFAGAYAPTYQERARNLVKVVEAPFPLKPFTDDVMACTEWKLSRRELINPEREFWERAVDYARALWGWELARLQRRDPATEPAELMALWMRRQPLHDRLRGWAHVVRQKGWHRSVVSWPYWLRRALETSPRYSVYAAATDLLFAFRSSKIARDSELNQFPRPNDGRSGYEPSARLPVQSQAASLNGGPAWRARAADVLLNYREFLVNTRA
jgi:hypothetical protein